MEDTPIVTPVSATSFRPHSSWMLPLAILISALMVSGSILYVGKGSSASILQAAQGQQVAGDDTAPAIITDTAKLLGSDNAIIGSAAAKVTMVEFSDFQCPFCRRFIFDTYAQLKKDYIDTGKVRVVYRDFPLPFHDAARPSALAGRCANEQGKFWEFHDVVFAEQEKKGQNTIAYGIPELKKWALQAGVNASQFNQCLDSEKYGAKVDAEIAAGSELGISGTPSFFINGQLVVGAQPYATFRQIIDAALAK